MILISLVGEQPIPNLLVARALKPETAVWAYTQRTQEVAERIGRLLPDSMRPAEPLPSLPPYNAEQARQMLDAYLAEHAASRPTVLNLTGGTKPMALAALAVAAARNLPFVYLQTEGADTVLYHYRLRDGRFLEEPRSVLPPLVSVADYLRAHGLEAWFEKTGDRDPLEELIDPILRRECDEVEANLDFNAFEVDFVIRRGNKVGVVECKRGLRRDQNAKRAGMDQLVIASEEKYLGTYTARILVTDRPLSPNLRALADARRIRVVLLPSAQNLARGLLSADERKLAMAIRDALGTRA